MRARLVEHPALPRVVAAIGVVLFIVGSVLTFRHIGPVVPLPPDYTMDFDFWMHAARDLARGADPYAHRVPTLGVVEVGYVYPPMTVWVLTPLVTLLPGRYPYLVWVLLTIVAYTGTLVMALRSGARPVPWHWVTLTAGAMALPFVIRESLFHGQIDFFLATLVTGGLVLLARRRPVAAGIAIAAAANVKPFLVILLLYLAWRGHWRAFFAMGFGGLAILVGTFALTLGQGSVVFHSWLDVMGQMGRPPFIGFLFNVSLYGTVVRLFTPTPFVVPWIESRTLYLLASAVLTVLPAAVWLWAVPPGRARRPDDQLMIFVEAGLLLTLVFACGPVAESSHLLSLTAIAIAVMRLAWGSDDADRRRRWLPAAIVWAVFLLVTLSPVKTLSWIHPQDAIPSGLDVLLTGKVGMLLLVAAITTAWGVARERAVTDPHLSLRHTIEAFLSRVSGRTVPAQAAG